MFSNLNNSNDIVSTHLETHLAISDGTSHTSKALNRRVLKPYNVCILFAYNSSIFICESRKNPVPHHCGSNLNIFEVMKAE